MEHRIKGVLRNLDRIEYVKTSLPEGFETNEEEYRRVKKKLDSFMATLGQLGTYEHGGTSYKTAMDKLDVIGDKLKTGFFKTKSFYKEVSDHIKEIGEVIKNETISENAVKFGECFDCVDSAKKKLNDKIHSILLEAEKMKEESKNIDYKRMEIKNLRYDLEKLHKKSQDKNKIEEQQKVFNQKTKDLLTRMKKFIEHEGLSDLIVESGRAHHAFFSEASKSLSVFK